MARGEYLSFGISDDEVAGHVTDSLRRHGERVSWLESGRARVTGVRRVYVPACVWESGRFSGTVDLSCVRRTVRKTENGSRTEESRYEDERTLEGTVDGVMVSACEGFPTDRLLALAPFDLSRVTDEPDGDSSDLDVDPYVDAGVAKARAEGVLRHTMEMTAVIDVRRWYADASVDGSQGAFETEGKPRLVWLPVVTCSVECGGRSCEVIVNGQTGEAVGHSPEAYEDARKAVVALGALLCAIVIVVGVLRGRGVTPGLVAALAIVAAVFVVATHDRQVTGAAVGDPTCGHMLRCLAGRGAHVSERTGRRVRPDTSATIGAIRSAGRPLARRGGVPADELWSVSGLDVADVIANPATDRREVGGTVSYS